MNSEKSDQNSAKKATRNLHVSIGDTVIVHNNALPRGLWKHGRIQEILSSQDCLSRSAIVRVVTRDRQDTSFKRPIQLLYPLEVFRAEFPEVTIENATTSSPSVYNQSSDITNSSDAVMPPDRSARAASIKARQPILMKILTQELEDQH